jgi:GTP-binding protein HflX
MQNKSLLVGVDFGTPDFEYDMEELRLLAESAGAHVRQMLTCRRKSPDAALFVGSGKAQEIADAVATHEAELVIFNHVLAPIQQRNLENVLKVRVLDRNSLILDIFALRAKSFEGKLQVELAQLQHLSTRLVRAWSHLERQKGGIGLRGPGETQLELDKRMIGDKIRQLKLRLDKLAKQRLTQRRQRDRRGLFSVSLVGYTNAGKSTLFNTLTHANAYAADQLFATLDTTTRRLFLAPGVQVTLADTVGFIRDLPPQLVEAFKATLEQTVNADLLLHVVDVASPTRFEQIAQVNLILEEIGAAAIPQIIVWNKIDVVHRAPEIEYHENGNMSSVSISARFSLGLDRLRQCLLQTASNFYEVVEGDAIG